MKRETQYTVEITKEQGFIEYLTEQTYIVCKGDRGSISDAEFKRVFRIRIALLPTRLIRLEGRDGGGQSI